MSSIRIQNFGGIVPRISSRNIGQAAATIAEDCELQSGDIVPIRVGKEVNQVLPSDFLQSIFYFDGAWLTWASDVDVVRGFVLSDNISRIYYTGDGAPKKTTLPAATASLPYPAGSFPLGVDPPAAPPTVVLGVGGSGAPQLRCYAYTYVTSFSEESAPSFPSAEFVSLDGQPTTVSGFSATADSSVNRIRIYRKAQATSNARFFFVAEIPYGATSFLDSVLNSGLGEPLPSLEWLPPPPNMIGLVAHPDGFMAGFAENKLYFSERYQPHAYPSTAGYVRSFDYPIVALGVFGNTIVVATTGYLYFVSGSAPATMTVQRQPDPYPCISKRSMVSADRGVLYASRDGLVFAGYGGVQVVTRDVLDRESWAKYYPGSIHGAVYDGKYYGWYLRSSVDFSLEDPDGGGFVFDYNDRATSVNQSDKLTTLSGYATAAHANPGINLHYIARARRQNSLLEWGAGDTALTSKWKSKEFVLGGHTVLSAAKVISDGPVLFDWLVNGVVKYSRTTAVNKPFRLPPINRTEERYQMQITAAYRVREIHVASSMNELIEGGNNG